jgi:hypothetical protein
MESQNRREAETNDGYELTIEICLDRQVDDESRSRALSKSSEALMVLPGQFDGVKAAAYFSVRKAK